MEEQIYMQLAIYLASKAEPHAIQSNPRVGAVLVHNGKVIGQGYHKKRGEAHAEVNCINSVPNRWRDLIPQSTMYVTLEPCAHQGLTPSCAKMLVQQRVKSVVIGTLDPFPEVSGKGVEILRQGGVRVSVGLLEAECKELAKVFLKNQNSKMPFITLKWAESADGFIDRIRTREEPSAKISTPYIKILNHRLRGKNAGILIGKNTLLMDRPTLTNRYYPGLPSPAVYVLDRSRETEASIKGRDRWHLISNYDRLDHLMNQLYDEGISTLLVEGGARIHQSFIDANLWDTIRQEISPEKLYKGIPSAQLPNNLPINHSLHIDRHTINIYHNR